MTQSRWSVAKSLTSGARAFVGFDDAYRAQLDGFPRRVRPDAPEIFSIRDAVLTPLVTLEKGLWSGGVSDSTGALDRLVLYRGSGKRRVSLVLPPEMPASPTTHLERAWFGGYLFHHYGHFLLEGLARVLDPRIAHASDPVVFLLINTQAHLEPFETDIFRHIGIDPARIVLCTAPVAVGELMVQDPAIELGGWIRTLAYRPIQMEREPVKGKVVYLSRGRLVNKKGLANKRLAMGEDLLEERLRAEFGAEIVHPEHLPFAQQVEKLAMAEVAVGCEGSAFYTSMFLRRAPHRIVLCPNRPALDFLLSDEISDGSTTYVLAGRDEGREAMPRRTSWELDVGRAMDAVRRAIL